MSSKRKLLAVASEGGHWVQLMRLRPAFVEHDVSYMTTNTGLIADVPTSQFYVVRDASLSHKIPLLLMAMQVLYRIAVLRPNFVVSTGAAPGFFAVFWGRLFGARTIWIDSIANSEELSAAGQMVGRFANHWLTQWPDLARDDGPSYLGSVL